MQAKAAIPKRSLKQKVPGGLGDYMFEVTRPQANNMPQLMDNCRYQNKYRHHVFLQQQRAIHLREFSNDIFGKLLKLRHLILKLQTRKSARMWRSVLAPQHLNTRH